MKSLLNCIRICDGRLAWLLFLLALCVNAASAAEELDRMLQQQLQPLLKSHCLDCHDSAAPEGDIALTAPESAVAMRDDRLKWLRALRQLQAGSMPPADAAEMSDDDRKTMIDLIDKISNHVDCGGNINPGKVTLRRLNRAEYRNTIRDLVGIDFTPAKNFPGDDVGYGFDNIGDVLSLPPLLLEKYLQAAEDIMGQAIMTAPPDQLFDLTFSADDFRESKGSDVRDGNVCMFSNSEVSVEKEMPFSGQYKLVLTAYANQAGDEPAKVEVKVDGKKRATIDVPDSDATQYEITVGIGAGKRKLSFAFINDYYKEKQGDQPAQDRNLYMHSAKLSALKKSTEDVDRSKLPQTHRELIFTTPGKSTSAERAAKEVITRFASRAFRRTVTASELTRLESLAARVRSDGGTFDESMQVAFQAVLISPHFLYKYEHPRKIPDGGPYPPLSDFELATRLSYFLWSSMPDEELLKHAWKGELKKPEVLHAQVLRMLKDRRIILMIDNFASQWLQLRNLDDSNPDMKQFPGFNDEVRALMRRETLTFFAAIFRNDRPVTMLLDGPFTYLNEPLAKFYGIDGVKGDEFQYVSLDGTPRGGLLTQAAVLTVTSNPTRTSPVKRGKWILDNILGTPPPPAPADVPELEKSELKGTLRERLVQHRENPACASCHNLMDPLGFALENFDAVGLWRDKESGQPIDASGELPGGTKIRGVDDLRKVLVQQQREQFVRCLTEKLLTFALGRGLEYYDKCAVDGIIRRLEANDYRFSELVLGIVESEPFQKQGVR